MTTISYCIMEWCYTDNRNKIFLFTKMEPYDRKNVNILLPQAHLSFPQILTFFSLLFTKVRFQIKFTLFMIVSLFINIGANAFGFSQISDFFPIFFFGFLTFFNQTTFHYKLMQTCSCLSDTFTLLLDNWPNPRHLDHLSIINR